MFTQAIIQKLKQNNISTDTEKTKQRANDVWKAASRESQNAILSLAGVARTTVQRAYKTGSISAKLVVPMAQELNISPLYLTGEADEPGECSEALLKELLQDHKYDKLLEEYEREQRKPTRRPRKAAVAVIASEADEIEEILSAKSKIFDLFPSGFEFFITRSKQFPSWQTSKKCPLQKIQTLPCLGL